jgi:activator of HSP90 ATPase
LDTPARIIPRPSSEDQAVTSKVYVALRVPADPMRAFEAFTQEIALWWRPSGLFQVTPEGDGKLAFEPGVGGRLFTTLADGQEFEIGRITVWDVGKRLVFDWRQLSFSDEQLTEVEVRFEAVGDETRISIEHRAWDTIPREHVARHGFPEHATLQRVADWWRTSLGALKDRLAGSVSK